MEVLYAAFRGIVDTVVTGFFLVFIIILIDELAHARKKSKR